MVRRNAGQYRGPFAYRQGKPMRPDVALAFDRMASAARADGVALLITSAFRTDAEQARLFAAHPDPKWVAPPGTSLHRLGTELDLGPPGAYGWLAANAERFHFRQRYAWEPWHFGFALNAGSSSVGYRNAGDGASSGTLPAFVPARFAPAIARAAQRWSVAGALLAAQLYEESHFNPFAQSKAGALGIAQFMPATAAGYGLADPFDADRAIDAQAHLMRDLLRRLRRGPARAGRLQRRPRAGARLRLRPADPRDRVLRRRHPRPAARRRRPQRRGRRGAGGEAGALNAMGAGSETATSGCLARQAEEISPSAVRLGSVASRGAHGPPPIASRDEQPSSSPPA